MKADYKLLNCLQVMPLIRVGTSIGMIGAEGRLKVRGQILI